MNVGVFTPLVEMSYYKTERILVRPHQVNALILESLLALKTQHISANINQWRVELSRQSILLLNTTTNKYYFSEALVANFATSMQFGHSCKNHLKNWKKRGGRGNACELVRTFMPKFEPVSRTNSVGTLTQWAFQLLPATDFLSCWSRRVPVIRWAFTILWFYKQSYRLSTAQAWLGSMCEC